MNALFFLILLFSASSHAAVQPVENLDKTSASSNPIGSMSLGNSLGKAIVMKSGTLVTVATTADQVIATYIVTTGKTFYLNYWEFEGRLTTVSGVAIALGTCSLENPIGTKLNTHSMMNPTTGAADRVGPYPHAEPIPIAAGTVIRVVCTPGAVTSTTWFANFGGYEK